MPFKDRNQGHSLILVRSPFQAWLADKIIRHVNLVSFDLVYLTYHDSTKDRFYFCSLSSKANKSIYLNVKKKNHNAIHHCYIYLTRLLGRGFCGYDIIMLASFDNYLFRMMSRRHRHAELITFDDGAANIFPVSSYHSYKPSRLTWLYDSVFGAGSTEDFKRDINKHYTIYPDFGNIVESGRVEVIYPWFFDDLGSDLNSNPVKFFIGQPFDEVLMSGDLDYDDILMIEKLVRAQCIDYYLQHPKEINPLNVGGKLVNDAERISEEVISELCDGRGAIIFSWFSTVLFNLPAGKVRKVYLSVGDKKEESLRIDMCEKVGCEVWREFDAS